MMSWTQQVLHVFSHDLRALRLLLALYAALLTFGVLQSRGIATNGVAVGNMATLLLYGVPVLLGVLLVLRHPPATPTSHWSSLPYSRSAVWMAKWLSCALVVAGMVLALVAVSEAFDMPRAWTADFVSVRALLLCGLLATSVLVAVVERNLRSALVMLVALPITMSLLAFASSLTPRSFRDLITWLTDLLSTIPAISVGIALAMGVGLQYYRMQRVSAVMRWSTMGGCVLLLISMLNANVSHRAMSSFERGRSMPPGLVSNRAADVTVSGELVALPDTTLFGKLDVARAQLILRLADAPTDLRADWAFSEVTAEQATGVVEPLRVASSGYSLLMPSLQLSPTLRWQTSPDDGMRVVKQPTVRVGDAWHIGVPPMARGVPRAVRGAVEFREARILGRLPIAAGARVTVRGAQIALLEIGDNSLLCEPERRRAKCTTSYRNGTLLRISMRSMLARNEYLSFALVHNERREGIRMEWQADVRQNALEQQLLSPNRVLRETGLLLPEYRGAERTGSAPLPLDERWLQGAELVVVEWVLVGEVPLTVTR